MKVSVSTSGKYPQRLRQLSEESYFYLINFDETFTLLTSQVQRYYKMCLLCPSFIKTQPAAYSTYKKICLPPGTRGQAGTHQCP